MHAIHELKEMLLDELEEYGKKDSLTASDLDIVDKLAHTVKNVDKIMETNSERREKRDSASRYYSTRAAALISDLNNLKQQATDEKTREEFEKFIQRIETM